MHMMYLHVQFFPNSNSNSNSLHLVYRSLYILYKSVLTLQVGHMMYTQIKRSKEAKIHWKKDEALRFSPGGRQQGVLSGFSNANLKKILKRIVSLVGLRLDLVVSDTSYLPPCRATGFSGFLGWSWKRVSQLTKRVFLKKSAMLHGVIVLLWWLRSIYTCLD